MEEESGGNENLVLKIVKFNVYSFKLSGSMKWRVIFEVFECSV